MTDDPTVQIAADLREIETLAADLHAELQHRGPRSDVMAMCGPVANLEAWGYIIDARDEAELDTSHVDDHDPDWEPPLQTLLWWTEQWRVEHDAETDLRPSIATEVPFLRGLLGWAYENEPRWADLAADVRRARLRLEAMLRAGDKPEYADATCIKCGGVLIRPVTNRGLSDYWHCMGRCQRMLTTDDYNLALRQFTEAHLATAHALAARLSVDAATIRQWATRGHVKRWGKDSSGRTLYRIGEVERHATRQMEGRSA